MPVVSWNPFGFAKMASILEGFRGKSHFFIWLLFVVQSWALRFVAYLE
jgi:hypothetical protein